MGPLARRALDAKESRVTPETKAVKELIAEIRADRKQRADDLRELLAGVDERLAQFRAESKDTRDEIIGLKLVLLDTRKELAEARGNIDAHKAELRMLSDFTGMTEKKAGNGHRGKR